MQRDYRAEGRTAPAVPHGYPYESDAMGCHVDQIPAMKKLLHEQHGIEANYTRDGCMVVESPDHRRKLKKALGLHDRNSYYG